MKRLAATLALVLGALPAGAQDAAPGSPVAPVPVDERRVVDLALADHPHVQAAEAERDAAEAARSGAKRALVPDVTLSGRYTRLSSIPARYRTFKDFPEPFPQILNNLGVRAELSVPVSDLCLNLAATARSLGHSAEASALELLNARAQIAYEARVAFLSYWRATLAVSTAEELVRAAESQASDQRAREIAGTVARNDVLTFEVALDAAVMQEQAARSELAAAEANLRSFFPSLATRPLVVPALPEREAEPESPAPPEAPARSSRIASLEEQANAARERAKSASLDRLPKLSLVAAGEYAAPSPRVFVLTKLTFIPTWEAGARISWSLSQATIGSTLAEREAANHRALRARVEEMRRKLDAERTAALHGLELAHARVQRAGERVKRASALAAARRGELEAGTALPLNVVLAETDLARAKNDHVDAVVERALALAKIDFVDGRAEPSRTLDGRAEPSRTMVGGAQ